MYLVVMLWPNISYAVSHLSSFSTAIDLNTGMPPFESCVISKGHDFTYCDCYEWTTHVTRLESGLSDCGNSGFGCDTTGP